MNSPEVEEVLALWQPRVAEISDWQQLVAGVTPKEGGCGLVYELPNLVENRPNESFAIADMRHLRISEAHRHTNGEVEVYIVLTGTGKIAVGTEIRTLAPGDTIVTPSETMHCVLPGQDLVLAVINTPPFNLDNYVAVDIHDVAVADILQQLLA